MYERRNSCILEFTDRLQKGSAKSGVNKMREKLTKRDVEKIEEEIEHRKLVIRKEAIEAVKDCLLYTSPSPRD